MTLDKGIPIANIYYMLAYAFNQEPFFPEAQAVDAEEFKNIYDLFAWILNNGISIQLKRGLYYNYENQQEDSLHIRGKIDIPGTMRCMTQSRQEVSCIFDELTANNPVNRVIKSTAQLLIQKADVDPKRKTALNSKVKQLAEISAIDLRRLSWSTLQIPPGDRNTRWMLTICRFIRDNLLMTTEDGICYLAKKIDEQHFERLYERFILNFYKLECKELDSKKEHIDWAISAGTSSKYLPYMETDITLSKLSENKILIIDAKYYKEILDKNHFHPHNLYQIFTYVKNKEAKLRIESEHKVSGMLLYAQTSAEGTINEQFSIDGNDFCIRTLNLNQDFTGIRTALLDIPREYFGE